MKPVVLGLTLTLTAGAAHAALAPQYYQQARDEAPNVVVLEIGTVRSPLPLHGREVTHGACRVEGNVLQVERGTLYRNGQAIALTVPCAEPNAAVPSGPTVWQARADLKPGVQARAWLDTDGRLARDQFQLLR